MWSVYRPETPAAIDRDTRTSHRPRGARLPDTIRQPNGNPRSDIIDDSLEDENIAVIDDNLTFIGDTIHKGFGCENVVVVDPEEPRWEVGCA